jgi:hypothetical protein
MLLYLLPLTLKYSKPPKLLSTPSPLNPPSNSLPPPPLTLGLEQPYTTKTNPQGTYKPYLIRNPLSPLPIHPSPVAYTTKTHLGYFEP